MIVETFPVGVLQCNCAIVGCEDTREALIIDPGGDPDRILAAAERLGLRPRYLLHTHAHFDHVGGTRRLADLTGAVVALHPDDRPLYEHLAEQTAFFGLPPVEAAEVTHWLSDGERLAAGSAAAEVLHTPGHTPGSVSCATPKRGDADPRDVVLFSGDTLFLGGVGRTDLWGGSADLLFDSIRTRLLALPDDTPVIPGHGPATTIGRERRTNPFLAD